jgi:uncharacterized protein
MQKSEVFDEEHVLHLLKQYLPHQAPLKDFIHHNTLHAFQGLNFHEALQNASLTFGYQVYKYLEDFRNDFKKAKISKNILDKIILEEKGEKNHHGWLEILVNKKFDFSLNSKIGKVRKFWSSKYQLNMDKEVYPILFRLISNFLDQGISENKFPNNDLDFFDAIKLLEKNSFVSIFKTKSVRKLFLDKHDLSISFLLEKLVGNNKMFENYLFDQQFAHPGWSGMVAQVSENPNSLYDKRKISLEQFIKFELLLELDFVYFKFGDLWKPAYINFDDNLALNLEIAPNKSEIFEVLKIWQKALEWTYYDEVLRIMEKSFSIENKHEKKSFQAVFCIDDREESIRRHLEKLDTNCETFGIPGFFNLSFYFRASASKFYSKSCPAPISPNHIIIEENGKKRHQTDWHFHFKRASKYPRWISPILGFWSALKMAKSIFYPTPTSSMISSFNQIDKEGNLHFKNENEEKSDNLLVGFTNLELAEKMNAMLLGMGMVKDFAPLVYLVAHGASSVNNTHYAGYDCGACSGRAGSPNARIAAQALNDKNVRALIKEKGIEIPNTTFFVAALHDTTRDEILFYDVNNLSEESRELHLIIYKKFHEALRENAKERSRRFLMIDTQQAAQKIHEKVKNRSVSLFEPRPEWNHASNSLCIVGRREKTKHIFFDRRAFLNSYNYQIDREGNLLLNILNAATPVCGGINLEYYFSKVDPNLLGAGSKLSHNVMGLFGVANGIDGDLRTGLPEQMVNIHVPIRLLMIVEHFPEVVLNTISRNPSTYQWYQNEWVNLIAMHPENGSFYKFTGGRFIAYNCQKSSAEDVIFSQETIVKSTENLPVFII